MPPGSITATGGHALAWWWPASASTWRKATPPSVTCRGGVTLAVSPYAVNPQALLQAARFSEHEYLLSLPMEPQSYPLNDPGPRALLTSLPRAENLKRLNWVLARIQGYVGVTDALGNGMLGARFAAMPKQMTPVLRQIAVAGCCSSTDGRTRRRCRMYGSVMSMWWWTGRQPGSRAGSPNWSGLPAGQAVRWVSR